VGFVGPQVIEMTLGTTLPPDSHRAETLLRAGMVDLIVPRPQLRTTVAYLVLLT
jgi:acetyl-CoA carboxylase carboxyl transferase subunit beta